MSQPPILNKMDDDRQTHWKKKSNLDTLGSISPGAGKFSKPITQIYRDFMQYQTYTNNSL